MFCLRIEKAGGEPYQLEFTADRVGLGRSSRNTVPLIDPEVSANHAIIERRQDQFVLIDRDSTNGTTVEGEPLRADEPCALRDGDLIAIGPFTIEFGSGADPDRTCVMPRAERIADQLAEQMCEFFARTSDSTFEPRRDALREWILRALGNPSERQLGPLSELVARLRAESPSALEVDRD